MKTILVPTDYSDTAKNAAVYAIHIAKQLQAARIVLYNAYQASPVMSEPAMPAIPYIDLETLKDISAKGMKHFREFVEAGCPDTIQVEEKVEFAILADEVESICASTGAECIVMGVTGTSKLDEVLIGSTAINVMKHTKVPVVIVPANNKFTSISNIVLATDLKDVVETTPSETMKQLLQATKANLHIVNVYEDESEISADKVYQQELLNSLFKEFSPQFHVINNDHFVDGINEFVDRHNIDLIVAIPKKHGFFSGMFKERHTRRLAFHSHVPLMYMHNDEL